MVGLVGVFTDGGMRGHIEAGSRKGRRGKFDDWLLKLFLLLLLFRTWLCVAWLPLPSAFFVPVCLKRTPPLFLPPTEEFTAT